MPIVEVDGQRLEFPDDMSRDEIAGVLREKFPSDRAFSEDIGPVGQTGLGRFVQQPLQGATLQFGDELSGAIGGVGAKIYDEIRSAVTGQPELLGDVEGLVAAARKGIEQARADIDAQIEQRPIESTALQMGGGIAGGLAGAATRGGKAIISSIGKSRLPGKVIKSGGVGATTGAISGAGGAEGGLEERIEGAKEGAGVGGAVGGAIPVVGEVAKQAVAGLRRTGELAKGRTADVVVTDILNNQNLDEIRKTVADGNAISSLVDVSGDEARGLLRSVAKKTGGTKNLVTDFLENRSEEAGVRINNLLSKKVSNVDNYFQNLDDLAKARQVASAPLYKQAIQKGKSLKETKRLNTLLQDPRIVSAIEEGKKTFGVPLEAKRNSVAALDGAKKALDDDIGALQREGRTQAAATLSTLKNDLISQVDAQVPEYKKARKVFSGFKSVEAAQEKGVTFLRMDPEEIARDIKGMTPSEHDAFLIGVRRALKNTVDRVADQGDPAKRIFGNQLVRDKIQAAFPDQKGFKEFTKRMREEIQAADTKHKVIGGSRTDFNQTQDIALFIDSLEAVQQRGAQGLIEKAAQAVFDAVRQRALGVTDANAKQIADILLDKNKGVEFLDDLIVKNKSANQKAVIKAFKDDFLEIRGQQAASTGIIAGGQQ